MNKRVNYLKNCKRFADEMVKKHSNLIKEWQVNAINKLNAYCKDEITIKEYCAFIRAYNLVLIKHEYWISQSSWLQYEINCEVASHG